ncbi:MAG: flagellar biosynthesis protein FlgC [Nitrospirae bacterium]|nr:flagellar biosynthesis protein FlgC [Candidatus Manganitrophaceae bacterium]
MLSPLGASLSGLRASIEKIDASANNVANLSTDRFKKDSILLSEGAGGGVVVEVEKSTEPGPFYQSPKGELVQASNADLTEESTQQLLAKYAFSMNLATLKTTDEMENGIIDLLA